MDWKRILLSLFILNLLTACGQSQQNLDHVDTTNLYQLESIRVDPLTPSASKTRYSNLRIKLLKDSAMSIGAQGGLAASGS